MDRRIQMVKITFFLIHLQYNINTTEAKKPDRYNFVKDLTQKQNQPVSRS